MVLVVDLVAVDFAAVDLLVVGFGVAFLVAALTGPGVMKEISRASAINLFTFHLPNGSCEPPKSFHR